MSRHWFVALFGLAALAACQSTTEPSMEFFDMRVTVSDVSAVTVGPYRGLTLRARIVNTGGVGFEIGTCSLMLYFLDPTLGWKQVTLGCSFLGESGQSSAVLSPGQTYEMTQTFLANNGVTYKWPVGGVSGTYRVGFSVHIGNLYPSSLLTSSDPFVVADTAGR